MTTGAGWRTGTGHRRRWRDRGAICRRFAAEGAEVAIADLDRPNRRRWRGAIAGSGGPALALQVDVTDEASAKDAVERTVASFGRLHHAGQCRRHRHADGTVETLSLDDWTRPLRSISPAPS